MHRLDCPPVSTYVYARDALFQTSEIDRLQVLGCQLGCQLVDYMVSAEALTLGRVLATIHALEKRRKSEKRKVLIASLLPVYTFLYSPQHLFLSYN